MSVYKPKKSSTYLFDFWWKGRRFHGSTGCKGKREAERFEAAERLNAESGKKSRPPITLDEACGLYADKVADKPSWPTTRYMLAALIEGLGSSIYLSEIGQAELRTFFSSRQRGRSNATVNREVENCRAMWRHAQKNRYDVGEMPDWGVLRLAVPNKDPRELSSDEEPGLLYNMRDDLRDAVQFALLTGWRRGEVLGLRWADIDFRTRTARTQIKGGDTVKRPLTQDMMVLIANQPKAGPFVFTYLCQKSRQKRRKGERYPLTATALRGAWAKAKALSGIEDFRFHDLRHTRGTRILRATGNLAAAKEALKHKNIKTTLRYAHAADDDVREALAASESRNIPEVSNSRRNKM